MGNHAATGNLRSDQEGRNHGRQAYQSQKLIHRKHRSSPNVISKAVSVRPLRDLLLADQKLIGIGSPGNRKQRQNRDNG